MSEVLKQCHCRVAADPACRLQGENAVWVCCSAQGYSSHSTAASLDREAADARRGRSASQVWLPSEKSHPAGGCISVNERSRTYLNVDARVRCVLLPSGRDVTAVLVRSAECAQTPPDVKTGGRTSVDVCGRSAAPNRHHSLISSRRDGRADPPSLTCEQPHGASALFSSCKAPAGN